MSTTPVGSAVPRLNIKLQTNGDATVVVCSGRLSAETASLLKSKVKSLLPGVRRIVLDLSELTYMDSSGLGTVVGLYVSARAANCEFRPINFNKQVREMLRITNLLTVFEACGQYLMKIP